MSTLSLSQTLPLETGWDVIVIGGGPAGCSAAIAAAREGARTLLVEQTQCLGGGATQMLVPAWCPFSDQERFIYSGLAKKIFLAAREGVPHEPLEKIDWVAINPEQLKRVYDDLLAEAGVTVAYQTVLSGAIRQPGSGSNSGPDNLDSLAAIVVTDKRGLRALQARVYIDATGDGDLAAQAGVPFELGSPKNGQLQPGSHCFIISNVDEAGLQRIIAQDRPRTGLPVFSGRHQRMLDAYASGRYPEFLDQHMGATKLGPGTYGFNAGHLFLVDGSNPADVSKCPPQGRKIAHAYHRAFLEFAPEAFGNSFLVTTGAQVGYRETRRIMGDYVLSLDDWLARRKFDDEICRNCYAIDQHTTAEEAKNKVEVDAMDRFGQYKPGETHGIPYRCLTAKGVANLLMAGRNISCDHYTHASIRVMPICLSTGEAAGIAAALAVQTVQGGEKAPDVRAVAPQKLRQRMRDEGAYLPE